MTSLESESSTRTTTLRCSVSERVLEMSIRLAADPPATLPVFRVSEESTTTDDFMRGEKPEVRQKMFGDYSIHPERAQLASNW